MRIELTLTKDHLKLIPFFLIDEEGDDKVVVDKTHLFCLGSQLYEDMATILGMRDKAIKNTQNDADGCAFDDETEAYFNTLYEFFNDNLLYLETLIHQFIVKGGLTEGTYTCIDSELIWEKIN